MGLVSALHCQAGQLLHALGPAPLGYQPESSLLNVMLWEVAPQLLCGPKSLLRCPLDDSDQQRPANSYSMQRGSYVAAWPGSFS